SMFFTLLSVARSEMSVVSPAIGERSSRSPRPMNKSCSCVNFGITHGLSSFTGPYFVRLIDFTLASSPGVIGPDGLLSFNRTSFSSASSPAKSTTLGFVPHFQTFFWMGGGNGSALDATGGVSAAIEADGAPASSIFSYLLSHAHRASAPSKIAEVFMARDSTPSRRGGDDDDFDVRVEEVTAVAAQDHVAKTELAERSERDVDAARAGVAQDAFAGPARGEEIVDGQR